jgi:hypothetical protein
MQPGADHGHSPGSDLLPEAKMFDRPHHHSTQPVFTVTLALVTIFVLLVTVGWFDLSGRVDDAKAAAYAAQTQQLPTIHPSALGNIAS